MSGLWHRGPPASQTRSREETLVSCQSEDVDQRGDAFAVQHLGGGGGGVVT